MPQPLTTWFVVLLSLWCLGEFVLLRLRRARAGAAVKDEGFARRAVVVFPVINGLAVVCWLYVPGAAFGSVVTFCFGLGLMAFGLAIRWWSVASLGPFFTVDVTVAADHRLIESGPYRLVRHPSYAAILIGAVGLVLCIGNFLAALVILVPLAALLVQRMRIEEAVLFERLGESYQTYMSRTKRLIPRIY